MEGGRSELREARAWDPSRASPMQGALRGAGSGGRTPTVRVARRGPLGVAPWVAQPPALAPFFRLVTAPRTPRQFRTSGEEQMIAQMSELSERSVCAWPSRGSVRCLRALSVTSFLGPAGLEPMSVPLFSPRSRGGGVAAIALHACQCEASMGSAMVRDLGSSCQRLLTPAVSPVLPPSAPFGAGTSVEHTFGWAPSCAIRWPSPDASCLSAPPTLIVADCRLHDQGCGLSIHA